MIYLDNAATSWPKPERVYIAADKALREFSGNAGRSGHRLSMAAGRAIEETRLLLARLFNVPNPKNICFTLNATDALNLAIKGILRPGDHVIAGSMEHNSVARPLEALRAIGVECTKVNVLPAAGTEYTTEPNAVRNAIRSALRPNTKLAVFNHVSNVTGAENPIGEIGALCREQGIPLLVDAAQSAGTKPVDVQKLNIDLLAFPGHKGLFGPQGTGGLYIREGLILSPLREGGTGSRSEELTQPPSGPDRYESGTMNAAGIAALGEGVRFILEQGIEKIEEHEAALSSRLIRGLQEIPGIKIYGPPPGPHRSGVVSVTPENIECAEAELILDDSFGIAVRAGLHCAPDAHRLLGTLASGGTIRISIGYLNTEADIDNCIEALRSIVTDVTSGFLS
ncbi:MAG: aminotransferase class V-fold PLP-dependent enzyme [Treponema sp.]|jgi:cysteine desulfurase family protein|nr:aminotransferase class V-fold PLP-dependent enzyme [Treponema sp.]